MKTLEEYFQEMKDYGEYSEDTISDMQSHIHAIYKLMKGGKKDGKTV